MEALQYRVLFFLFTFIPADGFLFNFSQSDDNFDVSSFLQRTVSQLQKLQLVLSAEKSYGRFHDKEYVGLPHLNLDGIVNKLLTLQRLLDNQNDNGECYRDIILTIKASMRKEWWALQMMDSNPKFFSGLIEGNIRWTGTYEQCLNAIQQLPSGTKSKSGFRGKYCWMGTTVHNASLELVKFPYYFTVCVPSSCNETDLRRGLEYILDHNSFLSDHVKPDSVFCHPEIRLTDSPLSIFGVLILLMFFVLILSASIYDYYLEWQLSEQRVNKSIQSKGSSVSKHLLLNINEAEKNLLDAKKLLLDEKTSTEQRNEINKKLSDVEKKIKKEDYRKESLMKDIFLSFSAIKNCRKIFSLKLESGSLGILHGLRVFSMFWVIFSHSGADSIAFVDNYLMISNLQKTFSYVLIEQGIFAPVTFFVLSGVLVSYVSLKMNIMNDKRFSWLKFYALRYLRLTPPYMLVIFIFYICLQPWMRSGPYMTLDFVTNETETKCRTYWWANALYVNNFIKAHSTCVIPTWYLAVDTQLYLISPIVLILLTKSKRWSAILGVATIIISSVLVGVMSYSHKLLAKVDSTGLALDMEGETHRMARLFDTIYSQPWCRISPYFLGMACGWLLYETKCKVQMSKRQVIIGWTSSIFIIIFLIFTAYKVVPTILTSAVYFAVCNTLWGLAVCWIIFACSTGYGGFINQLLCCPLWLPFSRLTYSTYLIHEVIISNLYLTIERSQHGTIFLIYICYAAFLLLGFLGGTIICLAFEAPIINIMKIMLTRE